MTDELDIDVMDEFITEEEILKAPRGRKAVINGALRDLLAQLEPGKGGVRLTKMFGSVSGKDATRSTVSQTIRKHFELTHDEFACSINYTPAVYDADDNIISGGVPQVFAVPVKVKG